MNVKPPKYREPTFYPILPRSPRVRKYTLNTDLTISKYEQLRYNRYKFSLSTNLVTRVTSVYLNESSSYLYGSLSKAGIKNPDWKQKVAKGIDAGSDYTRIVATIKPMTYSATSDSVFFNTHSTGSGALHGGSYISPLPFAPIDAIALGRLKNKLNGHIGNAQLMAPIAESREIHRIVRQINTLAIDAVKAALAAKATKGKSAAKYFGDAWLGFGFGVNPMLKDLEKAANSILDYTTRDDHHVRITGTASQAHFSSGVLLAELVAAGGSVDIPGAAKHVTGVRYVAGIDLQLKTGASYSVSDHLGLKITDIPSTLWELIPFSWAVDYFSTVSPWLEDMFYTLPGATKYINKASKYQLETVWTARFYGSSASYICTGNYKPGKHRYVSFTRNKLALTLPTRPLRFKTMDEVAQYGMTKFLNLASVLAGKRGPRL